MNPENRSDAAPHEAAQAPPGHPVSPDTAVWERQFLEHKEVYRQILDAIEDMILVKGKNSRILWANKAFCDYYGMTNEQLHEIIDAPFNEEGNTKQYILDDHFVFSTGQTMNVPAENVTRHDGVVHIFNTIKSPLRDQQQQVRMTVGVSRNITVHKEIEKQLAQHREHLENLVGERTRELQHLSDRLQVILRSLTEGIIAVDSAGRVTLMNTMAEDFTGCWQAESLGQHLDDIVQLEDEKTHQPLAAPALFRQPEPGPRLTAWLKPRHGAPRLVSVNHSPLIGTGGLAGGAVLIFRDISVERQTEIQTLRNEKLESLGLLAGGIAHDFNNLLMAILGNISLARSGLPTDSPAAELLEKAEGACRRARGLSTQLLTFSQGGAPVKQVLHLERPVREAAELALHGSPVTLEIQVSQSLDLVEADEGQLIQAVNNLVLNAKQAMPDGGRVFLALENVILSKSDERIPLTPGRYIRIKIQDTGPGIPAEHLSRIFDPYFTTKKTGSGLGLTSVHSIIARHGGHLEATSPPGSGACFTIHLPSTAKPEKARPAARSLAPPAQKLKLLALDDDPEIRHVFKLMLTRMGHQATMASTSEEAVTEFSNALATPAPYDLVFVDLTLSGDIPGEEVIRKLRTIHPTVQIVVMTGYATNSVLANHEELGLAGALAKPFDVDALRQLLNSRTRA